MSEQYEAAKLQAAADRGPELTEGLGLEPDRAAFEVWKRQHGGHYMSRNNAPGSDLSGYQDAHTQGQWQAWQAAVAAASGTPAPTHRTTEARDRSRDLEHALRVYIHAHQSGRSVPPHIEADALALLTHWEPSE